MTHLISRLIICTLCIFSSVPLRADCNSCNVTTNNTNCCSKNDCIKFKRTTKAFCALIAQQLDAENAYISNATFRNLRVLGNEQVDGNLEVNDLVVANGNVNINGTFTLNGSPFASVTFSEIAYFVRTLDQVITSDNTINSIVAFDTPGITPTSGITNINGVITFAQSGTYVVNFTTVHQNLVLSAFTLSTIPVSNLSNITGTGFATGGVSNNQVTGTTIIQVTAGQQIGVRNFSGAPVTISTTPTPAGNPNVAASIAIFKIN